MRVDEPHAVPGGQVLDDQVSEHRCFSRTRFPDQIEVLTPVGMRNADGFFAAPNVSDSNV